MKSVSSSSSLSSASDLEDVAPFSSSRRSFRAVTPARPGLAALLDVNDQTLTLKQQQPCNKPPPHFLDVCFYCNTRIPRNRDIFMYRGDTPFCSEECREEQIEKDEAAERMRSLSSKHRQQLKKKNKGKNSAAKTQDNSFGYRAGSVAVAS